MSIKAENVSKKYILRHEQHAPYRSLREDMQERFSSMFRRKEKVSHEPFWALKDVSFEIKQGERMGVIGRNGAGKSTLLKILSRITEPTSGRITIEGRVASLLEVGTGFHPELSGRENIFLNGAILGMGKNEIRRKFDEIVEFAEVERFLDTPVKRYSSGMYVRLAFSVAAHLEPEVLIVDEVLAVGDAAFQKKCIGKMKNVAEQGRTIIYVSHNIGSIRSLCTHAILLEKGELTKTGTPDEVIPHYLGVMKEGRTEGIQVTAVADSSSGEWEAGSPINITVSWPQNKFVPGWQCDIACYTIEGTKIFALESEKFPGFDSGDPQNNAAVFRVVNPGFVNNELRLDVGIKKHKEQPYEIVIENCLILNPSEKNLPPYKRTDVIQIPSATCTAVKQ